MLSTLLNRGVENDEPAVSLFPVMYNDVYDDLEFYVAEQNKVTAAQCFPGFSTVDVPYDGQCAFSAISHQLVARNYVNCEKSGDVVRREVVDFLSTNEKLKAIISHRLVNQTIDDYISAMRLAATWADEDILYVASVLYDVQITILRSDACQPVHIGSSSTSRSIVLGYVTCIGGSSPTHYVSLIPLSNAADVDDVATDTDDMNELMLFDDDVLQPLTPMCFDWQPNITLSTPDILDAVRDCSEESVDLQTLFGSPPLDVRPSDAAGQEQDQDRRGGKTPADFDWRPDSISTPKILATVLDLDNPEESVDLKTFLGLLPLDITPSDAAGQEQYLERGRKACPPSSKTNKRRVTDVQEVKSSDAAGQEQDLERGRQEQDQDRRERCRMACQRSRKKRRLREMENEEELVRLRQENARLQQRVVELEKKLGQSSR